MGNILILTITLLWRSDLDLQDQDVIEKRGRNEVYVLNFGDFYLSVDLSNAQAKAQVLQGTVMKIDEMENCPLKLYNLMRCCWQYEKKDRPTFAQLWEKLSNFDGSDSEVFLQ